MEFDAILRELKDGKYRPLYFLHGQEPFFIDIISDHLEKKVLSEAEQSFNLTVLYGKDVDHKTVVDAARRYPMMAPRQVVVLKEAQEMRTLKELQSYAEKPSETTILVIAHKYKKYNLNSGFGKALKKNALIFESKPLYDNQVPGWINTFLKQKGYQASPAATELIAEYLGTDLSKVANELEKLILNLPKGSEIDARQIEENIGISKDYNVFELQKALGLRDVLKANRIVHYFAANPKKNPLPMVIGSLYNYFSKVYLMHFLRNLPEQELLEGLQLRSRFFLKEYKAAARNYRLPDAERVIALLREYDLKSKGVDYNSTGKPEGELLKEMVWRILH